MPDEVMSVWLAYDPALGLGFTSPRLRGEVDREAIG